MVTTNTDNGDKRGKKERKKESFCKGIRICEKTMPKKKTESNVGQNTEEINEIRKLGIREQEHQRTKNQVYETHVQEAVEGCQKKVQAAQLGKQL